MNPFTERRLARLLILAMVFCPALAWAQILIPPSVIQQQADREHKASKAQTDHPTQPAVTSKDRQKQIEALQATALGEDSVAATSALHTLRSIGDSAKPALRDVVRQLLARDHAVLDGARTIPTAAELRELSEKISVERQAARDNIDKLAHDQTLKIAHEHYDALKSMWEKLQGAFAQADAISKALARRGELVAMWRTLMPADKQYSDDADAKAGTKALRELGFTAEQMSALPELGQGTAPKEAVLRDMWFLRACRRISAYNAIVQKSMSAGELENAQCVNTYREYLGILPCELDPRLVDAARGHSQEMVTLKYFEHDSPVPANRTPFDRMRNAGYTRGSGENIAGGDDTGEGAFWRWFDSPGHHQNMARAANKILGVGNAQNTWTQDFGAGPRLMLAKPEERNAALANFKMAAKEP